MKNARKSFFLSVVTLGFATVAPAATDEAKAAYKAAEDSATATYKAERAKCDALNGNPKDVCIEEAKAAEKNAARRKRKPSTKKYPPKRT
ncbi:cell envelope biogenesis protein TolA [Undibacterium arcticum]